MSLISSPGPRQFQNGGVVRKGRENGPMKFTHRELKIQNGFGLFRSKKTKSLKTCIVLKHRFFAFEICSNTLQGLSRWMGTTLFEKGKGMSGKLSVITNYIIKL